jgi:hypothetical protein
MVGRPDGKVTIERPWYRWKDYIKPHLIYAGGVWNDSTEYDAVAGSYEHNNDPTCSIKCGDFPDQISNY